MFPSQFLQIGFSTFMTLTRQKIQKLASPHPLVVANLRRQEGLRLQALQKLSRLPPEALIQAFLPATRGR
jgi:hypothetical protein